MQENEDNILNRVKFGKRKNSFTMIQKYSIETLFCINVTAPVNGTALRPARMFYCGAIKWFGNDE